MLPAIDDLYFESIFSKIFKNKMTTHRAYIALSIIMQRNFTESVISYLLWKLDAVSKIEK